MVVPHSNMFSTDNTATEATRRAVRAMQYGCRVGLAAVSEFRIGAEMPSPRLVLVPSPRLLRPSAWRTLQAWARRGSRVLLTGPLDQARAFARRPAAGPSDAVRVPMGRGAMWWSPVAAELEAETGPTVALYRWALAEAGIAAAVTVTGAGDATLVHAARYRHAVLLTVVTPRGERPSPMHVRIPDGARALDVDLPAERVNLVVVRRSDGRVVARYPAP
jgi:hypothetical protein